MILTLIKNWRRRGRRPDRIKRREWKADICSFLQVTGVSHEEIFRSVRIEFRDFEDCLQDKCAKNVNAKYIITKIMQEN